MAWAMGSGNMEEAKTPQRWAIYLSPDYLPAFLARMTTEYPWTSQDKDSGHWQLSSSPPARLDFTGFQWKPALSFDRNQAKEQHSCSGREEIHPLCVFTLPFCVSFSPWQQRKKNLESLRLLMIHTEGIIQNRPAVKPHCHMWWKRHF